jgi:hypothetical protein
MPDIEFWKENLNEKKEQKAQKEQKKNPPKSAAPNRSKLRRNSALLTQNSVYTLSLFPVPPKSLNQQAVTYYQPIRSIRTSSTVWLL